MVAKYPKLFANLPAADSGVKYQLEGYLFPATYEYTKSTSMEELVEKMITAMDANLQPYYGQLSSMGLTVNQLLTLASLVEKEGATDEDRRNIASVLQSPQYFHASTIKYCDPLCHGQTWSRDNSRGRCNY